MRLPTACLNCRSRKRKCRVADEGSSCLPCLARGLQCSLLQHSGLVGSHREVPDWPESPALATTPSHIPLSVDPDLCNELVDLYFDLIHEKQHILFHRPTFIASQRKGEAPMMLVLAMMALSSRFSSNPYFNNVDPWTRGRSWAEHSRKLFDLRTEAISLTAIQECSSLLHLAFIEEDMERESLYAALTIRMVQYLDLPRRLSHDQIEQELHNRVWWTTWSMDNWSSAGARMPKQLYVNHAYTKPMEEVAFDSLTPVEYSSTDDEPIETRIQLREHGLWSQMIPLTEVIGPINDLHEHSVHGTFSEREIYSTVENIAQKLDSWLLRLPKELRDTTENLHRYISLGHGRTFVALHLGFHHHSQLLYYQFLNQIPSSTLFPHRTHDYASRCKEHARKISDLLSTANSTAGCDCLWVVTGHLLVISSSIHLHTLLFAADESQISDAKRILRQNFEMIIRLQKYWPSMEFSMSRLRAFHRICRNSMETSFSMDQWMLQFLQRFMKPVDEKETDVFRSDLASSDWMSPSSQDPFELLIVG